MSLKSRKLSAEVQARRIDPLQAAALHAAIAEGDLVKTSSLLDAGVNTGARNAVGWPALYAAAVQGSGAIVARLLDAGADIDGLGSTEELVDRERRSGTATALMGALRCGHADVALLLLERGARVDHVDGATGVDALFLAAEQGLEQAVEHILRRGSVQQAKLWGEKSALDVAVERRHVGIVRRLLDAGFHVTPAAARLLAGA
jgi:ankyrin repeat protein